MIMATKTTKTSAASSQDAPPNQADVTPPYTGQDYRFEIQSLYEIQKTLGSLIASVEALKTSSDMSDIKLDIREIKTDAGAAKTELHSAKIEIKTEAGSVKNELHSAKIWILSLFGAGFIALLVVFSIGYLRISDHEEKLTSVMSDMRVSIQQLVDANDANNKRVKH